MTLVNGPTRFIRLVLLAVLWAIFAWASYSAWQAKVNYKPYDPFEILGISTVIITIIMHNGNVVTGLYRRASKECL